MTDVDYSSLPTSGPEPTRAIYQENLAGGPTQAEQDRRFKLGLTDQDRELGEAVTRVMARVPWVRKVPGMVMDVASDAVRRGNVNNLLMDMQDADTFLRLRQHYQELSAAAPTTQETAWNRMPMGMQRALRDQGYRPPSEMAKLQVEQAGIGSALGGVLHQVGKALDYNPLHIPGPSVTDIGGFVWDGLDEIAKAPAHVYRWNKLVEHDNMFKDPGHLLAAWRESADGEHLFDPATAAKVRDMFDDPKAYQFVKRLAAGESAYDIAGSLADPTSKNYPTAVGQVMDFAGNATVQQAVSMLAGQKISPGRDLARTLGIDPTSNLGAVISGAGDAAFQWYANPLLIAGAAKTALLEARLGIGLVDGENVVERVKGFYGTNLNELAAGRVTDVTHPDYWKSLRGLKELNGQQRAAVVIADHVGQGKYAELAQALPGTERLIPDLAANSSWIKQPADVGTYFSEGSGLTALAKGEFVNYRYQFKTLPQLTRAGTLRVAAKVNFEDIIDFASDAALHLRVGLTPAVVAAANIDDVQRAVGNGFGLLLQPVARAYQKLSDLIPTQDFITLTGPDAERAQQFDRFLSFGIHGSDRKQLYNELIAAKTEAAARTTAQSAMETIFANLGLRDSPDTRGFVQKWLGQFDQRYALDDLDINPTTGGRSGIFPDVDRANAIAIPKFNDLMAEVRRVRAEGILTGWRGEEFAQRALQRFEPVIGGIDTANRLWRQFALLSYSFAMRVGGEEAVNQYARYGPSHTMESWLVRPMSAPDPGEALLSQLVSPSDPMLARRALRKVSNPIFSILPDEVRFSARSQAEKIAAAAEGWFGKQTDSLLGVTDLEKRALRQPSYVDRVARAFDDVGAGKKSMMYGLDAPPRERQAFVTISQNTVRGPISVDLAKVGGKYDEYVVGDPVFRQVQADRLQHLAADRVARARLTVRSVFLDEGQANRIAGVVAPGVSDGFSVIEDARRTIGEIPAPLRDKLANWVHDPVAHDITAITAEARAYGLAHPEAANLPSIIERMPLLNTSDRMALLADPARALPALDGGIPDHWHDLLDQMQRGHAGAWHQLENEVGAARMKEADVALHVKAMDRTGAAFGVGKDGLSMDEALDNWSEIQRQALDQATLRDGRVVHGLTVPMSTDRLDTMKHVIDADFELPVATIGPGLEQIKRGRSFTERVVNGAWEDFDRIIGGISRTPLAQRAYVDAYVEADRLLGAQLRSPELMAEAKAAIRGDLHRAGDALQEIDHRLEEAYRAGSADIRNAAQLDNDLLRHALESHGVKLVDDADMNAVRHWWAGEASARDHIARVASDRMLTEVTPYIHDPSVRSQFAESHRWAFPFLFAQEQFYKRWGRTFAQSPEALMRLSLLNHGMNASGWLEPDPNTGQPMFVYPGSSWTNRAIGRVVEGLTLGKMSVTLPISAPLTGQLQTALPGLEHLDHLPSPGPVFAVPLHLLARLSPEVGQSLEHSVLGDQGEGRDLVSTIVPSRLKRFYDAITASPEDMAGSTIAAMQIMEANDLEHFRKTGKHLVVVPGEDITGTTGEHPSGQLQQYIDRLTNHSRIVRITQALFGFAGPASPRSDLTPGDLDAKFGKLLQSGMPIEEALGRYLAENPDATPYTVFATHSPSHAPTDPSVVAYDTMIKHQAFFEKYDRAAAWFLPETPAGADSPFDLRAWREMLGNQVRTRKGLGEMWKDIKYAEAAPEFFKNSQKVTEALAHMGDPSGRQRIREYWHEWSTEYQTTHPVFAELYNSNSGSQERAAILKQTTRALADPEAPKLPQNAALQELVTNYAKTTAALDAMRTNRTEAATARKKAVKTFFAQWAAAFTEAHPTAQAFYQRIIFPDLGIPAVTDSGA